MPKRPIYAAHRAARKVLRSGWYFDTLNTLPPHNPQTHGPYADSVEAHYALAKLLPGKDYMNDEIDYLVLRQNWGVEDAKMDVACRNIQYALGNPNVKISFSKIRHEPRKNPKIPLHAAHKAASSRHPLTLNDFKRLGHECKWPLKAWEIEITKRFAPNSPQAAYPQVSRCFNLNDYLSPDSLINDLGYKDFKEFQRDFMISNVSQKTFPEKIEAHYHPITDFFEMERIGNRTVAPYLPSKGTRSESKNRNIKYKFVEMFLDGDWDSDRFVEEWEDRYLGTSDDFEKPTGDGEGYAGGPMLGDLIFKTYDFDDFEWLKKDDDAEDEEDDDDFPY